MIERGLVFGKFLPFHRGHQALIDFARLHCKELIVLVCCSDREKIDAATRLGWIRHANPDCQGLNLLSMDYLEHELPNTSIPSREASKLWSVKFQEVLPPIDGVFTSELYGEYIADYMKVKHICFDRYRKLVPVSSTAIRQDRQQLEAYLSEEVYRDTIVNVVFLGAPSTGKTTLAEAMAKQHGTQWMPEYGRTFWEENQVDRRLTPEQLVTLAAIHLEKETDLLAKANRYLFTDTNAMTTYLFSQYYHGKALPSLHEYAHSAEKRYDLFFLCGDDIPYDDTWDRSGAVVRTGFQQRIIEDLKARKVPYRLLVGDLKARMQQVNAALDAFDPYRY